TSSIDPLHFSQPAGVRSSAALVASTGLAKARRCMSRPGLIPLRTHVLAGLAALALVSGAGCSDSKDLPTPDAGSDAPARSGGSPGTGGNPATGGAPGTGGNPG